ncbi:hypothetical protein AMTR_s00061p00124280, partial [Amborella trichopoda]
TSLKYVVFAAFAAFILYASLIPVGASSRAFEPPPRFGNGYFTESKQRSSFLNPPPEPNQVRSQDTPMLPSPPPRQ